MCSLSLQCIRGASEPRADFHSSKLPHPRTLNPSCHQRLADPETNCPHANCGKQKRTNGTPSRRHQIGPPMQQQQQQQQVATVAATCNMPLTQTDTAKEKKNGMRNKTKIVEGKRRKIPINK